MLRDPREVERAVDDLRTQMQAILAMSDEQMPQQDRRDAVMRMTGEIGSLEAQARELRDHEIETLRASIEGGTVIGGRSEHADAVDAYRDYLVGGIENAALLTTPDANGGFLMPYPLRQGLVDAIRKNNPIAADATVFQLTKPGTFKVELPRKTGVTNGAWVAETDARPATNAPTFARPVLECFEWYAQPEATQSALDAIEDAESLITGDIADTWAEITGTAWATGSGSGQPTGMFSTAAQSIYTTKLSSTAASIDAAQILGAYFQLPAKFLPTAKFYAKGATFAVLSALAWPNLNNTPLVRWETGKPTIMGKECVILDDAPTIGAAAFPLAFGELKRGYAIGQHTNISTLRDPFTNKPYVRFYTAGRTGGIPWDPAAVLLLKSNNS
jgi:HK97 family phage major capsid protein